MTGSDEVKLSARNQLQGQVARLTTGAINSEVVLELPGGGSLAAVITEASVQALGLAIGAEATALFKASSVIIGVAA
jgi:molybdate transport system regulatory protein